MDALTDGKQGTSTLHHLRLHTAHTFWRASVWRLHRSGALPTRADAALLSPTVASADLHRRIVGCGPSGGAAYHAWSTLLPNLFHSERTHLPRHYNSYYCCYYCRYRHSVLATVGPRGPTRNSRLYNLFNYDFILCNWPSDTYATAAIATSANTGTCRSTFCFKFSWINYANYRY